MAGKIQITDGHHPEWKATESPKRGLPVRDYAKISPQFWIGKTGKELRAAGHEAQLVALYLMSNPHANWLGLYYLPVAFIAHETGLTLEGALKGLRICIQVGFCSHDEQTEMVFVHGMASYQIGESLDLNDKKCKGIHREYEDLPDNPFLSMFYERYAKAFHLPKKRHFRPKNVSPSEGASVPPRSTETETETETATEPEREGDFPAEPPPTGREVGSGPAQPTSKEPRKSQEKKPAEKITPQAQAFLDAGGEWPKGRLSDGMTKRDKAIRAITETVSEQDVEFFKQIVSAYCAMWCSTSYTVMLDYYRRREIPGKSKANGNGNRASPWPQETSVQQVLRETFQQRQMEENGYGFPEND